MRSKTSFCNIIHTSRAHLHLDPPAQRTHHSGVQRFIAVSFRRTNPVAQAVRLRIKEVGDDGIYHPTLRLFRYVVVLRVENNAHCKDVVYLLERHILSLHLMPYGIDRFRARLDVVAKSLCIEALLNRPSNALDNSVIVVLVFLKFSAYHVIHLRVFILKAEVLQFGLNSKKSQSIGDRCVDVKRLGCYAITFMFGHRLQRTHIMQSVRELDEYDAHVFYHGHEQLPEVLHLQRCILVKHALELRQAVDYRDHFLAKECLEVA